MAIIKPFQAVRPAREFATQIAALPYDVMNSEEARKMVENKPYSFLHVDKAEIDLDKDINIYDKRVYEKAKENLYNMINNGVMLKDNKPNLYIYRLKMNEQIQTGLVACASVDDYLNNVIKKHEHTREDKEQDRINHVNTCSAHTGPIFLTYKHKDEIDNIIDKYTLSNEPEYNFTAEDGISHTVWIIKDENIANKLCDLFKNVDNLYIADGHHRAASAVKVGVMKRKEKPNYTGNEEFNFFLSVLFPNNQLKIMDYNRVVKDLNGLKEEEFIEKVAQKFLVEKLNEKNPYKPTKKGEFGMYLNGKWYKLLAKAQTYDKNDVVNSLDVSILQNNLLEPILGIVNPRTDKRIDFIGGIRGLKELEERVKDGMEVAFSMYPASIDELIKISDENKIMPPKSTWFEPKLRSGLFIHPF